MLPRPPLTNNNSIGNINSNSGRNNKCKDCEYKSAAALKAFLVQFHTVNPDTGKNDFIYARLYVPWTLI